MTARAPGEALPARAGLSGGLLTVLFLVVAGVGVLIAVVRGGSPTAAAIGEPAPAIAVNLFDGEVFNMTEHFQQQGGPVLLNLWASWCPPCVREFPALSDFAEAHPGITVVGVAVQDTETDARAFAERLEPTFAVGWDRDGDVRAAYPSFGLPATFLIDSDGRISDVILAELTPERLGEMDLPES